VRVDLSVRPLDPVTREQARAEGVQGHPGSRDPGPVLLQSLLRDLGLERHSKEIVPDLQDYIRQADERAAAAKAAAAKAAAEAPAALVEAPDAEPSSS
jgi:hypothetical protein